MICRPFHVRTLAIVCALVFTLALVPAPPTAAAPPDDLALEPVVSGLTRPVAVRHAGDGSGRLFILEQDGRIQLYRPGQGLSLFLDINTEVDSSGNEQGLLGLAFHPDFASNGFFYVNYTHDPGAGLDRTRIERYQVSAGDPDVADPASAFTVLEFEQDFSNHNGGDVHFGPDGYLYVAAGDGGSAFDPNDRAQHLDTLLGKILRIDVDDVTPPPGPSELCGLVTSYGVPADNPFVGSAGDCDEIWAYGLRNPWRFSFDRTTGDLLIGDVGQDNWEEIDFQPATSPGGENYGWSCMEGDVVVNFNPCDGQPLIDPVLVYGHTGGNCSVTGGFRYRGSVIGGFGGNYVYGDYCSGRVWFATPDAAGIWTTGLWMDTSILISSFGEDEAGELYVTDLGGTLYRFESPSSIFTDGFESGDVSAWSTATPGPEGAGRPRPAAVPGR